MSRVKTLLAIISMFSIFGNQLVAGNDDDKRKNTPIKNKILDEKVSNVLTVAGTAAGVWIGKGIGNRCLVKIAYFLNEPESGSIIRGVGAAARKASLAKEWGPWGSWAGGFAGAAFGAWVFSYSDDICYSFSKCYKAIEAQDSKDIEKKDVFTVGLTVVGIVAVVVDLCRGK